ncbi:uncharacterized protein PpBr36_06798 [Pyricularia pennisetigena]|uniref:uncharacterized protein n=1 Tax=Pyricularia pennisetigena TaxID=1578925 RepID=UPI001154CCD7|nr:uncharacterized protein PpBr36_06798 [Pyricularia pennisetigena]TLS23146.1 hypothetical protein PpBr36_06798 [Pyricularia pennisetigena]
MDEVNRMGILNKADLVTERTAKLAVVSSVEGKRKPILSDLCAKYESSMSQATFLANVERQLKPYTLKRYFNHTQQRNYGVRIQETLRPKARCEMTFSERITVINLSDVADAVTNKSNTEHATETIHDSLEAYYKVAYKREPILGVLAFTTLVVY